MIATLVGSAAVNRRQMPLREGSKVRSTVHVISAGHSIDPLPEVTMLPSL
jgi:hypothetical protein